MPSKIVDSLASLAVPIDSLSLLDGNPRRGDVAAVARSFERFGQRKPIVARTDGTVIAGNHSLLAARQLEWDEIAVVYVDDDDATARAFAVADNRISDLGSYDENALADYLALILDEFDDLAATGYTEQEVSDLLMLTGKLADYETAFLDDIHGEMASLDTLPSPDVDIETLTFLLPKAKKADVLQRLRQYMQDHDLDTLSDALYFRVTD